MKRFFSIVNIAVLGLILTTSGAQAEPPTIDTDESMHNLDPYYWVYSAAYYKVGIVNPNLWPKEGHTISIGFSLEEYEGDSSLTFSVEGLTENVTGGMVVDPDGIYRGTFDVSEISVGEELFKPGDRDLDGNPLLPKAVTLTISDDADDAVIATRQVNISRWACDRCHLGKSVAMEVYPWSDPAGGMAGPHSWPNILGRYMGRKGFDYNHLTNDSLTHTPTEGAWVANSDGVLVWVDNPLNRPLYHQMTNVMISGAEICSPCHQGSGRVRHAYGGIEGMNLYLSRERSMTVKCIFCHSNDSGYIPDSVDSPHWEDSVMQGWN